MKETRRHWLKQLLETQFKGDRKAFLAMTGLTKGRLSQMEDEGFGDTSAARLVERLAELRLPSDYFDKPVPGEDMPELSLEAMEIAKAYEKLDANERKRLRWFMILAKNGIDPTHIPPAPPLDQAQAKKSEKDGN